MIIIEAILLMIGAFLTIMMINAAFRLGNRISVATEATALSTAALYHALSPEAKARADAALEAKAKAIEERAAARGEQYGMKIAIVAGIVLVTMLIVQFARAEGITTQLFDASGNRNWPSVRTRQNDNVLRRARQQDRFVNHHGQHDNLLR